MSTTVEAVYSQDADGTWLVEMPGLPGCHTFGATFDEAREHARDAVRLWLESSDFELTDVVGHSA